MYGMQDCDADGYSMLRLARDMAGWFVQDCRNILRDIASNTGLAETLAGKLTFRLYLVVALVASTPFLMLLVARWLRTVWLG